MVVHKEENSRTTQKAAHYWWRRYAPCRITAALYGRSSARCHVDVHR